MGDFVANYVNEKVMFGAVPHVARVVIGLGGGEDGDRMATGGLFLTSC